MKYRNQMALLIALVLFAVTPMAGATSDNHAEHADDGSGLDSAVCHVCRVHEGENEPEAVVATAEHAGHTYGFCSEACRDKFVAEPTAYLPPVLPRPAPSFEALNLEGVTFSSEAIQGQWTLLDFWATWCQPCVTDLPKLTALHDRYSKQGFAVVSVSIDEGKKAAKKVARMIKKRKATHPVYLDSETAPAWAAYNVKVVPAQFLISPQGQIVAQWSGSVDLSEVEAELKRFLENG